MVVCGNVFPDEEGYGWLLEIFRRQDEKGCLIDCAVLGICVVKKEGKAEHQI